MRLLALLLLLCATSVDAQQFTIQGKVTERGSSEPIAGAIVQLAGSTQVLTNPAGAFVFTGVKPGRRTLTVNMLGYRRHQSQIEVRGELSVMVELEVEAVRVEGVNVRARNFAVRGQVKSAVDSLPIMDADVLTSVGRTARSNSMGRFRVSGLPVGPTTTVQVQALGMLPHAIDLSPAGDTVVNVFLQPDPVGQRMIENQLSRLDQRARAAPESYSTVRRADLMKQYYSWTVKDIVERLLKQNSNPMQCLVIDERAPTFAMEELQGFLPDQIERIEIFDRGTMVRVYTRRYVHEMMRGRVNLVPVLMVKGLNASLCK